MFSPPRFFFKKKTKQKTMEEWSSFPFYKIPKYIWIYLCSSSETKHIPFLTWNDLQTLCLTCKEMKTLIQEKFPWKEMVNQAPYLDLRIETHPHDFIGFKDFFRKRDLCSCCVTSKNVMVPRSWLEQYSDVSRTCFDCFNQRYNPKITVSPLSIAIKDYNVQNPPASISTFGCWVLERQYPYIDPLQSIPFYLKKQQDEYTTNIITQALQEINCLETKTVSVKTILEAIVETHTRCITKWETLCDTILLMLPLLSLKKN